MSQHQLTIDDIVIVPGFDGPAYDRLFNVAPSFAMDDEYDIPFGDSVFISDGLKALALRLFASNSPHDVVVNLCQWMLFAYFAAVARAFFVQSCPECVSNIFRLCRPFQVCQTVIHLVSINVIAGVLEGVRRRSSKSQKNQAMNGANLVDSLIRQSDHQVTTKSVLSEYSSSPLSCFGFYLARQFTRMKDSIHAAHASQVRHFVQAFVPYDGHPSFGFKFFGGKFLISHSLNLTDRFGLRSGSLAAETACGPLVF